MSSYSTIKSVSDTTHEENAWAGVQEVTQTSGRALDKSLQEEMRGQFNYDFSGVRIHTDELASHTSSLLDAHAFTVGNHVAFNSGQYAPSTQQGRRTLNHEMVHVIQQQQDAPTIPSTLSIIPTSDAAEREAERSSKQGSLYRKPVIRRSPSLMLQPRSLGTIPLRERRNIQVSTMVVTVPTARITAFFTLMSSGNPGETRSLRGVTNSFASNIPAALHVGLGSVGAWIQGDTNALPLNSSIEVDLDLSSHGGSHSTYRFTYFAHTSRRGRRRTTGNIMLIELVGNTAAAPTSQTVPTGSFTIGTTSFRLAGNWSTSEYAILRQALSMLPPRALTDAAGVRFRKTRQRGGTEAGEYDQATDTIKLHNNAFPASSMRIGGHSRGVHNILHELGHALDLRVLARAWTAFNSAGQPQARRGGFLRQRSLSGSRWIRDSAGNYSVQQRMRDASGAFRRAATQDRVRRDTSGRTTTEGTTATLSGGITSYSDTDYQELYAETFALYISAPETLRQVRPNIYRYFSTRYPRPSTP